MIEVNEVVVIVAEVSSLAWRVCAGTPPWPAGILLCASCPDATAPVNTQKRTAPAVAKIREVRAIFFNNPFMFDMVSNFLIFVNFGSPPNLVLP